MTNVPEEVTDFKESVNCEVVYSTFDQQPSNHCRVAELVFANARRRVEQGQDVMILLDSITRLGRAYNQTAEQSGRTLTGGLDISALQEPKRCSVREETSEAEAVLLFWLRLLSIPK